MSFSADPKINMDKSAKKDLINSVKTYLDSHIMAGVGMLAVRRENISIPSYIFTASDDCLEDRWEELYKECVGCRLCELSKTRTNVVFGEGNKSAKIVFIGEAPGRDEDLQAKPFVGRAGQLLTRMIEAMNLKRTDVYICNVLKCRPPDNRPPQQIEISVCRKYLEKQIGLISPKVICTLGRYAAQTILGTIDGITTFRGKQGVYKNIPVIPTYHPAYLLRNLSAKQDTWEDLQKVTKILEQN